MPRKRRNVIDEITSDQSTATPSRTRRSNRQVVKSYAEKDSDEDLDSPEESDEEVVIPAQTPKRGRSSGRSTIRATKKSSAEIEEEVTTSIEETAKFVKKGNRGKRKQVENKLPEELEEDEINTSVDDCIEEEAAKSSKNVNPRKRQKVEKKKQKEESELRDEEDVICSSIEDTKDADEEPKTPSKKASGGKARSTRKTRTAFTLKEKQEEKFKEEEISNEKEKIISSNEGTKESEESSAPIEKTSCSPRSSRKIKNKAELKLHSEELNSSIEDFEKEDLSNLTSLDHVKSPDAVKLELVSHDVEALLDIKKIINDQSIDDPLNSIDQNESKMLINKFDSESTKQTDSLKPESTKVTASLNPEPIKQVNSLNPINEDKQNVEDGDGEDIFDEDMDEEMNTMLDDINKGDNTDKDIENLENLNEKDLKLEEKSQDNLESESLNEDLNDKSEKSLDAKDLNVKAPDNSKSKILNEKDFKNRSQNDSKLEDKNLELNATKSKNVSILESSDENNLKENDDEFDVDNDWTVLEEKNYSTIEEADFKVIEHKDYSSQKENLKVLEEKNLDSEEMTHMGEIGETYYSSEEEKEDNWVVLEKKCFASQNKEDKSQDTDSRLSGKKGPDSKIIGEKSSDIIQYDAKLKKEPKVVLTMLSDSDTKVKKEKRKLIEFDLEVNSNKIQKTTEKYDMNKDIKSKIADKKEKPDVNKDTKSGVTDKLEKTNIKESMKSSNTDKKDTKSSLSDKKEKTNIKKDTKSSNTDKKDTKSSLSDKKLKTGLKKDKSSITDKKHTDYLSDKKEKADVKKDTKSSDTDKRDTKSSLSDKNKKMDVKKDANSSITEEENKKSSLSEKKEKTDVKKDTKLNMSDKKEQSKPFSENKKNNKDENVPSFSIFQVLTHLKNDSTSPTKNDTKSTSPTKNSVDLQSKIDGKLTLGSALGKKSDKTYVKGIIPESNKESKSQEENVLQLTLDEDELDFELTDEETSNVPKIKTKETTGTNLLSEEDIHQVNKLLIPEKCRLCLVDYLKKFGCPEVTFKINSEKFDHTFSKKEVHIKLFEQKINSLLVTFKPINKTSNTSSKDLDLFRLFCKWGTDIRFSDFLIDFKLDNILHPYFVSKLDYFKVFDKKQPEVELIYHHKFSSFYPDKTLTHVNKLNLIPARTLLSEFIQKFSKFNNLKNKLQLYISHPSKFTHLNGENCIKELDRLLSLKEEVTLILKDNQITTVNSIISPLQRMDIWSNYQNAFASMHIKINGSFDPVDVYKDSYDDILKSNLVVLKIKILSKPENTIEKSSIGSKNSQMINNDLIYIDLMDNSCKTPITSNSKSNIQDEKLRNKIVETSPNKVSTNFNINELYDDDYIPYPFIMTKNDKFRQTLDKFAPNMPYYLFTCLASSRNISIIQKK